jgi:hypothetical protein
MQCSDQQRRDADYCKRNVDSLRAPYRYRACDNRRFCAYDSRTMWARSYDFDSQFGRMRGKYDAMFKFINGRN